MKKLILTRLKVESFTTVHELSDLKGGVKSEVEDSYTGACCSIEPACPSAIMIAEQEADCWPKQ